MNGFLERPVLTKTRSCLTTLLYPGNRSRKRGPEGMTGVSHNQVRARGFVRWTSACPTKVR